MSSETIKRWQPPEEEIVPYKISVSSKYLDLTKQKLQLTRLPREPALPAAQAWTLGTPKTVLEPLLDAWLDTDQYDWRAQEQELNTTLPQFRTVVHLEPGLDDEVVDADQEEGRTSYRVHFSHRRGERLAHAEQSVDEAGEEVVVPLLYVHGYPGSFVEVRKVIDDLSRSHKMEQAPGLPSSEARIVFDVVAPSLPGFGFSDAPKTPDFGARDTVRVLDALMCRLGYGSRYIVACAATGWAVGRWWLFKESGCCAVFVGMDGDLATSAQLSGHAQEPQFLEQETGKRPLSRRASIRGDPASSSRWKEVFKRSKRSVPETSQPSSAQPTTEAPMSVSNQHADTPSALLPQTRAHALCDSPAGLLAHTLSQLHDLGTLASWPASATLTWTMLSWLPGPEAGLRWARATAAETWPPLLSLAHEGTVAAQTQTRTQQARLGVVLYHQSLDLSSQPSSSITSTISSAQQLVTTALPSSTRTSWTTQRRGRAGIPALDHADDFVRDVRAFCAREWRADAQLAMVVHHGERPRTAIRG